MHMGISRTEVPPDVSDLFSTWFRMHTIALCCQVLEDHPLAQIDWRFNHTCSMGWHSRMPLPRSSGEKWFDRIPIRMSASRTLKAFARAAAKYGKSSRG
jgi:hypothetical protein